MVRRLLGFVIAVGLGACGGGSGSGISPRQTCEDSQANLCERLYTCYTADELAAIGMPSSEAACISMLQDSEGCSAQTTKNACTGNETFHASAADQCVDQIAGLSCSQVRDPALDIAVAAPACAKVCVVD